MSSFVFGMLTTGGFIALALFAWDYYHVRKASGLGVAAHAYLVQVQQQAQAQAKAAEAAIPGPKIVPMPPRKES